MAQQIGEDTKITLDLKTIGMLAAGIGTIVAMWFALQADIAEAKELPVPPSPDITAPLTAREQEMWRKAVQRAYEAEFNGRPKQEEGPCYPVQSEKSNKRGFQKEYVPPFPEGEWVEEEDDDVPGMEWVFEPGWRQRQGW